MSILNSKKQNKNLPWKSSELPPAPGWVRELKEAVQNIAVPKKGAGKKKSKKSSNQGSQAQPSEESLKSIEEEIDEEEDFDDDGI